MNSNKPKFTVRELTSSDNHIELLELLSHLTSAPPLSHEDFLRILKIRQTSQAAFTRIAVTEDGQIIGSTSLVLETKFFRNGGTIGHVEDVVVHPDYRGIGVARCLMDSVTELAKENKCYKIILDCTEDKIPVYQKMGFNVKEIQMRLDIQ